MQIACSRKLLTMSSSVSSASGHASVSEKRPKETVHTYGADIGDEVRSCAPILRGKRLTAALAFVAGTGFTLFGYVHVQLTGIFQSLILMSSQLRPGCHVRPADGEPGTSLSDLAVEYRLAHALHSLRKCSLRLWYSRPYTTIMRHSKVYLSRFT